jgi:O-antigen ligase
MKPYTDKSLAFLLGDVQLFLLIFPFTSLFAALPAIGAGEVVINALNALLIGLSIVYIILMQKKGIHPADYAMLLTFLAFFILSVLWAHTTMLSNSITFTTRTIITILQTFVIVKIYMERGDHLFTVLKRYAIVIALLSLLFMLLFPGLSVWTIDDTPRVQSFFSSPNNMGQFLAFAFLAINFYKREELPLVLLLFLDVILLYQFFKCDSMTSLAGIIVILACYHFRPFLKPLFIAVICAGLLVPHINKIKASTSSTEIGIAKRDLTFTGRTDIWDIMLKDLKANDKMLFGFGSGGYWVNEAYNPISTITDLDWDPGQGHNGYLDVIAMTGIVGMLLFLLFIFDYVRTIFRKISFDQKVVYFFILIILFNNITESSFFRAKHFYFVLLMVTYWYVFLIKEEQPEASVANEATPDPYPLIA